MGAQSLDPAGNEHFLRFKLAHVAAENLMSKINIFICDKSQKWPKNTESKNKLRKHEC